MVTQTKHIPTDMLYPALLKSGIGRRWRKEVDCLHPSVSEFSCHDKAKNDLLIVTLGSRVVSCVGEPMTSHAFECELKESLCLVLLLAGSVMFVILLCHTYGSPPPSPRSCPSLHSLFHFSSSSHQPSSSYNAAESFSSARTDLLHGNHAHKSPSSTRLAASDNEFTSTKLAANLLLLFSLYVGLLYHRGNWRLQAGVLGEK